jgi:hypothetical protein
MNGSFRRGARLDAAVDSLVAVGAAAIVLFVYLATIYPGLVDIGDAAKFSFVGRVLGTPHAPGYPLYVMVSHLFSYLPWGTLAYRMNALSAIFGAAAVAMTCVVARQLGAGRVVACVVALALGFGQSFWAISLYAKAYTLHAFLVALGIGLLLRWSVRRTVPAFLWAVGVFALAAGNHLTVVALVPALVIFSILTDPRTVLSPKVLVASAVIVFAGLCQYLLILIRTHQRAPYLEARARTLRELWGVMTARRFAHEIGAFSISQLAHTRLPIVAGLIGRELGAAGLVLLAIGLAVLARRQPRRALLLGLGAFGVALLTANMGSGEDRGFLLAVFVLCWMMAAVGLQWVVTAAAGRARALGTVALVATAAVPLWQVAANYRVNDHHAETAETDYFDALFAEMPNRSAFVNDEYRYNMLFLYKLLGERANGARDIRYASTDRGTLQVLHDRGYQLFALGQARDQLSEYGFGFAPYAATAPQRAAALGLHALYRATVLPSCDEIGNLGWTDITNAARPLGRLSVRIDNYRPFEARLVTYEAAESAWTPAVVGAKGTGVPSLVYDTFARNDTTAQPRLAARLREDGATMSEQLRLAPFVIRTESRVNDRGQFVTYGLDLGPVRAVMASALIDQNTPRRATVCSHPFADINVWPQPGGESVELLPDSSLISFEQGWYAVERRDDGLKSRWSGARATLVVPIGDPAPLRFVVNAAPLDGERPAGPTLTLVVNGHRLATHPLPPSRVGQEWHLGPDVLRDGLNEFDLEVTGAARPADVGGGDDRRLLGVSVTSFEFRPDSAPAR